MMIGHEDLVGVEGVAAGAAHARHEPRVFDRDVAVGDQRHGRVQELAFCVVDRYADVRPICVVGAAGPVPRSGDDDAAVDLASLCRGVEHAGDAGVGVGTPHIVLRLLVHAPDEECAYVHQRSHPRRRTASFGDLARDLELGADVGLPAAVALRHHDLECAGFFQNGDVLLDHPTIGLRLVGVLLEDRADCSDALQQAIDGLGHCRVPFQVAFQG